MPVASTRALNSHGIRSFAKSVAPVPTKFLGLSPIEEGEGALSFVDRAGRGRTILVDGFERLAVQMIVDAMGRETETDVHNAAACENVRWQRVQYVQVQSSYKYKATP